MQRAVYTPPFLIWYVNTHEFTHYEPFITFITDEAASKDKKLSS